MFGFLKRNEDDKKVQNYVREYKKLLKRFMRFHNKNEIKRKPGECIVLRDISPLEEYPIDESNPATPLIRKFSAVLKTESYAVKKSFVDILLALIDNGNHNFRDPVIFYEIFIPVFVAEYKNENAKYIEWVGRYGELFPFTMEFLKQVNALDVDHDSICAFKVYFFEKSFLISKNQKTLDRLMERTHAHLEYSGIGGVFAGISLELKRSGNDLHKELEKSRKTLKPYIDKLEKCKWYCQISGNDKWEKRWKAVLDYWDAYIAGFLKYLEHVEKSGYICFSDYEEGEDDAK